MPMDVESYIRLGLHEEPPASVNGRSNADIASALNHPGDAAYHPCPEAYAREDVAPGRLLEISDYRCESYPDTTRRLWLYHSAGMQAGDRARLLLCNDGGFYRAPGGAVRATSVLDNMVSRGELGPTWAIFVNPGRPLANASTGYSNDTYDPAMQARRLEYDSLDERYADFLVNELLPYSAEHLPGRLLEAPSERVVCGISSGGIAAFTSAWQRPNVFGSVLSHCGSYTNINGGHNYPYLIRTTERKAIRVFLQSGENDAATLWGDWPTANQAMAKALQYTGYEHRFEFGTGGHSLRHGGALFADSLRWLWRLHESSGSTARA